MADGRPADGPPTPLSDVVSDSERPSEATVEPGLERTMDFLVEDRLVTDVGGSIGIRVLSTPGMIGMMERTAAMLVRPVLEEGKATVGFEVNVKHVGAARKGDRCSVHARLEEIVEGRKLRLAVEVTAEDGRTIGLGRHERRVIDVGAAREE